MARSDVEYSGNPFLITGAEYTNAIGKTYRLKYYPNMNLRESK